MIKMTKDWLDILERLYKLFKPVASNTIAKTVIGVGIALVAGASIPAINLFILLCLEKLFPNSTILQKWFDSEGDPTVGMIIIAIGLVYHAVVTVGKGAFDSKKAKEPELTVSLKNGDDEFLGESFAIRGRLVTLPPEDSIPECEEEIPMRTIVSAFGYEQQVRSLLNSNPFERHNSDLYRERSNYLKRWAGSELISFDVTNESEVMANGVDVKFIIPRNDGVKVEVISDFFPTEPERRKRLEIYNSLSTGIGRGVEEDISLVSEASQYIASFTPLYLQANTCRTPSCKLLLRVNEPTVITCEIYGNELSKPIVQTFKVYPPAQTQNVTLEQLAIDDDFSTLIELVIMDGYVDRAAQRFAAEFEAFSES